MIREGIALLNQYYYQQMQDQPYTTKKQRPQVRNDNELAVFLKIIECFAGVLGLRSTMRPYIPDEMRLLYAKRKNEIREREEEKAKREIEEKRRLRPRDPMPEFWITKYTKLEDVPTDLLVQHVTQWRQNALAAGFSIHEIDQFIQWKVKPLHELESKPFKELVKLLFFRYTDEKRFNREFEPLRLQYTAVMSWELMVLKFGMDHDKLPEEEVFPYLQLIQKRTLWQLHMLHQFLFHCLWYCPVELERQPVKTPSGKYDESLRVERTQQDLNNETANELSNLPRFQAYVKLIDESGGKQGVRTHKMQTHPMPSIQSPDGERQAIANGYRLCKKREEIKAEIRARQDKWGRGGSPPPTRRLRD